MYICLMHSYKLLCVIPCNNVRKLINQTKLAYKRFTIKCKPNICINQLFLESSFQAFQYLVNSKKLIFRKVVSNKEKKQTFPSGKCFSFLNS